MYLNRNCTIVYTIRRIVSIGRNTYFYVFFEDVIGTFRNCLPIREIGYREKIR